MSYSHQQGASRRNVAHPPGGGNSFSMDFDANFGGGGQPNTSSSAGDWSSQQQSQPGGFGPPPAAGVGSSSTFYQPGPMDFGYAPQQQQHQQQFNPMVMPGQQQPHPQAFASASMMNQQLLMAAGQQILANPMTAAAVATYSQSIMNKGRGWMESIKFYFGVDTSYVSKKLMLIFLPFLHKNWTIRYNSENVLPKDEPNLPDLYIPSMAFITYILLSGYILGLQQSFAPEKLGVYASSALAWLILEVLIIQLGRYFLNITSLLGFFHLIAFGGYKFVSIVAILLGSIAFGSSGYYVLFLYNSLSLGYFLLRSLNSNLQMSNTASYQDADTPRSNQYLVLLICFIQPIVIYFLTSGFLK